MRYDGIYLTGLGAELGQSVGTPWMVRRGALAVAEARRTRQRSVCVASESGPELAARAARKAVLSHQLVTGRPPSIRVHLHASTYDKPDFWSAACFVLDQLGVSGCGLVCEIDAHSNGMVLGLDMAASLLGGRPDLHTALVTGGDRFAGERFARYRTDYGVLYGDAGAAMLLGRTPGIARVVSAATCTDPVLEGLTRDTPATTASRAGTEQGPIDLRGRQRAWLRDHGGLTEALRRHHSAVTTTMRIALADADLSLADARWIVLPFLGHDAVWARWLTPLGINAERTLALLGLHLGHLGAADHIVGLRHLLATGSVEPGDHVVLASAGAGMTWTTAVLQIMDAAHHARYQHRVPAAAASSSGVISAA